MLFRMNVHDGDTLITFFVVVESAAQSVLLIIVEVPAAAWFLVRLCCYCGCGCWLWLLQVVIFT